MSPKRLTPEMITLVARRFAALAEPARLHIMQALRGGERTVGDLVEVTGLGTANVSKHLQLLHRHGFVARRKEGVTTWYRIADPSVFELCDLVCGGIRAEARSRRRLVERLG